MNFYLNLFNIFRDMLWTKLYITKTMKGNNYINTNNRVMVLTVFTKSFPSMLISVYQVSFYLTLIYIEICSEQLIIAKSRKGNNSVITCDRVTMFCILHFLS